MVLLGLPVIITHIIVAMANSPLMLYLACFLQGLCQMVTWVTGSTNELACLYLQIKLTFFLGIYISEISHRNLRNQLGALQCQFNGMGLLLGYIFGYLFGWRITSLISCSISLLSTILLLYAPETPYWLIQQNDVKEARYEIPQQSIK